MPRYERQIETAASPEQVRQTLIDFSPRRTEIWPYLASGYFEVLELGDTWALVREGSGSGPMGVWAVERYDWSEPGVVRWKVEDSNAFASGTELVVRITPRDGGGSRVDVRWERAGKTIKGKMIVGVISALKAKPIFDSYRKVFDKASR
jgi:hypothetical protein